jgi:hypothetical protein
VRAVRRGRSAVERPPGRPPAASADTRALAIRTRAATLELPPDSGVAPLLFLGEARPRFGHSTLYLAISFGNVYE